VEKFKFKNWLTFFIDNNKNNINQEERENLVSLLERLKPKLLDKRILILSNNNNRAYCFWEYLMSFFGGYNCIFLKGDEADIVSDCDYWLNEKNKSNIYKEINKSTYQEMEDKFFTAVKKHYPKQKNQIDEVEVEDENDNSCEVVILIGDIFVKKVAYNQIKLLNIKRYVDSFKTGSVVGVVDHEVITSQI